MTKFLWVMTYIVIPLGFLAMLGGSIACFTVDIMAGFFMLFLSSLWVGMFFWFRWLLSWARELAGSS